ncbi:LytTR family DNA-binding domain-containing protein [Aureisphaera galaxeae]|uniref:LytR/AlgR family response regulator transcription factor n=1 Tax=Aureisphaera galaxeae TaxID=1538023 RepID=UPI00235097DE|nr:LytTR family DNA-binding domain-containing protein [Aureisphaera galaxeae]MDC8005691.1 LytTR family DNA-binding domain-containing protein [Aureisphaera galaxeae]
MKCIVVDDESASRAIISHLCSQIDYLELIAEFPNAMEAFKYLNKNKVDLIFLDIHMPDFTGFDFIDTLKSPPKIILTTSDRDLAIEAFEYDCIVDYLVKPLELPRFERAIQRAVKTESVPKVNTPDTKEKKDEKKELYVNIDRRLIKIDFEKIFLIEAKGDYILIKTSEKNYTVHSTLKKIEEKLPDHLFLKIHRSYIINFTRIIDIEDNSVLIEKDVVPISRSNRPELMRRLNLL